MVTCEKKNKEETEETTFKFVRLPRLHPTEHVNKQLHVLAYVKLLF